MFPSINYKTSDLTLDFSSSRVDDTLGHTLRIFPLTASCCASSQGRTCCKL